MRDGQRDESERDFEVEVADVSRSGQAGRIRSVGHGLSPRQRIWRLAITSGVLALVIAALALDVIVQLAPQVILPPPFPPLALRPQTQGMTCLVDASWSPQGTRVALLGKQRDTLCPDAGTRNKAGLLTVYDISSGKLMATQFPDATVVPILQTLIGSISTETVPISAASVASMIEYQHVLWSPDGQRLALTFMVDTAAIGGLLPSLPDGEPTRPVGIFLVDVAGGHPQVFVHLVSAFASAPIEWDLRADTLILAPTPPYFTDTFGTYALIPPALAYQWQARGRLVPDTLLSAEAPPRVPPLAPVGNPDGGRSFTTWQPGFAGGLSRLEPSGVVHLSGVYTWSTALDVWSPDGRYVLQAIAPDGLIRLPGAPRPTAEDLRAYYVYQRWLLPLRDPGLAQVLRGLNANDQAETAIAWRPDGLQVAAFGPETEPAPRPIAIYDCTNGRQLVVLLPPLGVGAPLAGQYLMVRWSPDGSHLLVFGARLGAVLIWGPDQLPR